MTFSELWKAVTGIGWKFHDHAILGGPIYYAYSPGSKKRTDLCFHVHHASREYVNVNTEGPGEIKVYLDSLYMVVDENGEAVQCLLNGTDDILLSFYNFKKKETFPKVHVEESKPKGGE